jgi:hypothetical protein
MSGTYAEEGYTEGADKYEKAMDPRYIRILANTANNQPGDILYVSFNTVP